MDLDNILIVPRDSIVLGLMGKEERLMGLGREEGGEKIEELKIGVMLKRMRIGSDWAVGTH